MEDGSETNMLKWNLQIQDDGLGCKVNSRHYFIEFLTCCRPYLPIKGTFFSEKLR